jgi:azurin
VTVNFNNGSTVNPHNWVLANGGDDVAARVDQAATTAGPSAGYLPTGADVIAGIRQLNPGESGTASFTAPAAGTYTYICTTPGHFAAGMKGTLTVQ